MRKNNFKVSDTGYFVYCNGIETGDSFENIMKFDVYILDYKGTTDWIEPVLKEIKEVLDNDFIPDTNEECETCSYVETVNLTKD